MLPLAAVSIGRTGRRRRHPCSCTATGTTHPLPVLQPTPGQARREAAVGQGVEYRLGAAVPAKAAAGQPWMASGWGGSRAEGAWVRGSATHHLTPHQHSNTSPFINSNYFLFPFIMINTRRLRGIKYWLLLNIYRDSPPSTSQTFLLAQYGPKTEPVLRGPARYSLAASGKSTKLRGWFLCWYNGASGANGNLYPLALPLVLAWPWAPQAMKRSQIPKADRGLVRLRWILQKLNVPSKVVLRTPWLQKNDLGWISIKPLSEQE